MLKKMTLRILVGLFLCSFIVFSNNVFADKEYHKHHKKQAVEKVEDGLSIMILGSGGPDALNRNRASAGYMVFVDKKPEILMDAGGGVYQRIADSGMNISDLDTVLLSHLHLDHMGDMAPITKALYFHNLTLGKTRTAPIHFYGPDAALENAPPPAFDFDMTSKFVDGHFDSDSGLNRYMYFFAKAIGAGAFAYKVHDIAHNNNEPMKTVLTKENGLLVKSIGVPHGPVPSLAFRIEYNGKSIVYSGDTSSANNNLTELADKADLLIYDTAILDDAVPPFSVLHTTPTRIGQVAASANVKKLVLSHLTPATVKNIKAVKQSIRQAGYHGPIKVARDLKVFNLHDD